MLADTKRESETMELRADELAEPEAEAEAGPDETDDDDWSLYECSVTAD